MKKISPKIIMLLALAILLSCEKSSYLSDGSDTGGNEVTGEQLWAHKDWVRNFLNNAYIHLPDEYSLDGDGGMMAAASDEAVNSNGNTSVSYPNNGTWAAARTFNDVYADMYTGIRKANLFIENVDRSGIVAVDEETTAGTNTLLAQIKRAKGQAYFLRAFYHFELLKRYGAIPLVTKSFTATDNTNLPKNTYDECVAQIVADCNTAIEMLPLWSGSWNTTNRGRATKMAASALKTRLLLYAASPLNNSTNDQTKWRAAADAAKEFLDLNANNHKLFTSYAGVFTSIYNTEYIFGTKVDNRNDIEQNNAPISYSGAKGRTNPTQNLVDAFETKTGVPVNPLDPYTNRDPRFDASIYYNNSTYKSLKVETFVGGKDGLNLALNATRTGYYLKKFFVETVTYNQTTNVSARRPWILFRYAELLLNYAEAVNELVGPDVLLTNPAGSTAAPFTLTARQAINQIRARTGVAMPALPAGLNKDDFRERIKNERRVELCFEGHRFYDVRRWDEGNKYFNVPARGMQIVKTGATTFIYTPFVVENRIFTAKNNFFPFSLTDINRQPALVQNPGY